jgi:hypothetical protein
VRTPALTARNAVINTATVRINTLTIEGKQVTLSVFRQLIEAPIFDWQAMALRGIGWGHVRYQIEQPPEVAINLVWQDGDNLRRCILQRRMQRAEPPKTGFLMEYAESHGTPVGAAKWFAPRWTPWGNVEPRDLPDVELEDAREPGGMRWRDGAHRHVYNPEIVERNRQKLAAYGADITARYAALADEINAKLDHYEQLVAPMFDLPQLFIAV